MTEPFSDTYVLFVDMLGFASLVEEHGDELSQLSPVFAEAEDHSQLPAAHLLAYRFINFHRCLNQTRTRLQELGAGTAIVFSDSAFLRIDTLEHALEISRSLMYELVIGDVPARMGLAIGSYRMLRFLSDSSAQVTFHMSQFLGTGVIRAHQAESCGAPGLRILLHPNLEPLLDPTSMLLIPLETKSSLKLPVRMELNYLQQKNNLLGPAFDDCIAFDSLSSMWAEADSAAHHHYRETYDTWQRMRSQFGRPPYPWEKFLDRDEYDYKYGVRQRPEDSRA